MSFRTIQQGITAGNDFDGTAPAGSPTFANDIEAIAAEAAGGLFDFENSNPVEVRQVSILLGGQISWSLVLVDVDDNEFPFLSGTTEASVLDLSKLILLEGQKLKLTTTGASTAMTARITIDPNP